METNDTAQVPDSGDQEQVDLLRAAAIRLYFDSDTPEPERINVAIWRRGVGTSTHAIVDGHFGGGGIRLTGILRPDDELFTLAGLLVVDVAERDDSGRPTRVWALRALPEFIDTRTQIYDDWEYATSLARISYDHGPTGTWEEPEIFDAAVAWGLDCGAPRRIVGWPPGTTDPWAHAREYYACQNRVEDPS